MNAFSLDRLPACAPAQRGDVCSKRTSKQPTSSHPTAMRAIGLVEGED